MLLGFKKRFKQPILDGTKKFTIRERRKIEPKIGETLYMYTGLRTSDCEKISDKHKLVSIQIVDLIVIKVNGHITVDVAVDARILSDEEIEHFVVADGFTDPLDFADYWLEGARTYPDGTAVAERHDLIMHHWTDLRY